MRSLLLIWCCCICFNAICQTDSSDQDNTYPRRMGKVIQSTLPIPARVKKDGAWVRNPALDDYKNVPSGNGIKANSGGNLSSSSPSGRPGGIEQTEPGNPNNQTVNQPGAANANNQHENPYTEINLGPPGSDHEQNSRGSLSSSSSSGRPGSIQQTEPGNPENQTVNQPGAVNANNQHENPNTETNSVPPWGGIKQNPRGNFSSPPGRPGSIQQTATGNPDNPYTRPPANPHDEQGLPAENPGSIQQTATGNPNNQYTRPPANPHADQGLPAENPGSGQQSAGLPNAGIYASPANLRGNSQQNAAGRPGSVQQNSRQRSSVSQPNPSNAQRSAGQQHH